MERWKEPLAGSEKNMKPYAYKRSEHDYSCDGMPVEEWADELV